MKQNIIHKLILIGVGMAIFQSCADDFLELEPKTNLLEANAYKTEEDAYSAVIAVYDALSVQNWSFVPITADIFSDDAYCGGESGGGMWQWQALETSIIDADNSEAENLWNRCYSGIYRANMFFDKEDGIEWTSENYRTRLHAEVRVLRAYFYWDLVRHFGWVPVVTELLPSSEDYKSNPQKNPDEVYGFIAEELLMALPDLPETVVSSEKGRITQDVARILLARIYLFYEGFAKPVLGVTNDLNCNGTEINKAYTLAAMEEIISSERYRLLDDYNDVFAWDNEGNDETIFEFHYSDVSGTGDWGGWTQDGNFSAIFYGPRSPDPDSVYSSGWSFAVPTWSLYNEFEEADSVRRKVSIFNADKDLNSYSAGFQNTGYFNHKYMPQAAYYPTNGGSTELNWPKNYIDMRLAEVYLIAAELYIDENPEKAAEYLNKVRTRAMGESAALSSVTLDDIYHERRIEFAGEGHRKWDLLRRGLNYAKECIDASWDVPDGLSNADEFTGREFNIDTWGMLPIPECEIRLANNGVLEQKVPAFR